MNKDFWRGRKFVPLLVTQFFGAFNDNLFKNTLMTFVAFKMMADAQTISIYSNLIAGIFILPYFLFSALAGLVADKYNRAMLARRLKVTELILMLGATAVFLLKSPILLIIILFFMGLQSTFFGPIKYSLLPQLLRSDELVAGNAYIEASTYISIILGATLGTLLPMYASIILLLVCAVVGMVASYKIPDVAGMQPNLKINFNIVRQIKENIKLIRSHVIVYRTIIGATWFWILGTFFLTAVFPLCSKVFNTEQAVVTLFLILFSVGVGAGSISCNKLLKGEISVIYVPISAVGLSVCAFLIYVLSVRFEAPEQMLSLGKFMSMPSGWMMAICLFMFAFMGGMYIVPLNTLMQKKAPKKHTASVIAGNNIINSLGMAGISLFAALLIGLGFKITDLFLYVAIISAAVAFYICRLLPDALVRSLFRTILQLFFRVEVNGVQNLVKSGKTLIIANHVSLLDGLLVAAYLPRKITFAIDSDWACKWYVRLFDGLVDFYPLNPANPLAIRSLIEQVNKGKTVIIFPEGRISITGSLMKVYEGAGLVAQKTGAKLVPIRISGAEYSKFSYIGSLTKTKMFPKIKMFVLPAVKLELPDGLTARERRQRISLKLHDIMADMIYETSDKNTVIFNSLLEAEKTFGKHHKIALDKMKKTLSYSQLLLKTYVLGEAYAKEFVEEKNIGILLPNSLVAVVSFFALHKANKVPVMMNFSLGKMQFASCIKTTGVKTVVTAHQFIEQGKLEHLESCLVEVGVRVIYLEDLAPKISGLIKLKGIWQYLWRKPVENTADEPAVVLFTSGSEGLPKAVLLSHKNLQANILQVRLAVPFNSKDIFLNALPMFHSFGLTVGTILPLLNGVKTFFYPSPLHYRIIPEVAYDLQATVICGTDTFLYGYGRMANPYDFFQVRFAVVGGEKLKERTAQLWHKKFGVRIFEGYGATETSPVISVNTPMYYRENSVGRLLPMIKHKLVKTDGVESGGELWLKSDTVMLGYIKPEKPLVLQKADEWYDTGDVVEIDEDGFVFIQGRAKRFAKIAGEMVSLTAIEQLVDDLYPEAKNGIIAVDDERKGEKIILITSDDKASAAEVKKYFREKGVSELWMPREVIFVKKPPLLGSGKFDYLTAKKMFLEHKF